jgi:hypothetical protein
MADSKRVGLPLEYKQDVTILIVSKMGTEIPLNGWY